MDKILTQEEQEIITLARIMCGRDDTRINTHPDFVHCKCPEAYGETVCKDIECEYWEDAKYIHNSWYKRVAKETKDD